MFNGKTKSEIQKDPLQNVPSIEIIPLQAEKEVMRLKPNREAIFHGDCELVCFEGRAEIINPLPGVINLIDDTHNKDNQVKRYYIDGMIFGIRAEKQSVKFSLLRPSKWK